MTKQLLILLIILTTVKTSSQEIRRTISGKIIADSLLVENIHIINKNTRRVALTNKRGEFEIPVRINDTLVFSAVQFAPYQRIVVPQDFKKIQILIKLKVQQNELKEIELKRNNIAIELGLPNAERTPKTQLEARLDGHSKARAPIVIIDALLIGPLLNKKGGINNLYYLFSGQRKKDIKLQKLFFEDQIIELNINTTKKIRLDFKDDFFIYILKIPNSEIDAFISHCINKGLTNLYVENKKIELIELMLNESSVFLNSIKNEKK